MRNVRMKCKILLKSAWWPGIELEGQWGTFMALQHESENFVGRQKTIASRKTAILQYFCICVLDDPEITNIVQDTAALTFKYYTTPI